MANTRGKKLSQQDKQRDARFGEPWPAQVRQRNASRRVSVDRPLAQSVKRRRFHNNHWCRSAGLFSDDFASPLGSQSRGNGKNPAPHALEAPPSFVISGLTAVLLRPELGPRTATPAMTRLNQQATCQFSGSSARVPLPAIRLPRAGLLGFLGLERRVIDEDPIPALIPRSGSIPLAAVAHAC